MSSCLMAGALALALAPGGHFTLEWIHSVEKDGWREEWQVTDAGLVNTLAAVKGSGAGMEPGEGGHWDGDWWVWEPHTRPRITSYNVCYTKLLRATTMRWFGMITKNTLADMIVAVKAPRCSSAARPVKTWV